MRLPKFSNVASAVAARWQSAARLAPLAVFLFAIVAPGAHDAAAQSYPSKPVRIIVPANPGSGDDLITRVIASKLSDSFGQQFLADNRPGAGGFIGQSFVAKSLADGYTLLLGGGSMAGARYVNAAVTYDVLRDFTQISLAATIPSFLVVHPSVPARNVKEFIALVRSRPGKMTFGTQGAGQMLYWNAMLFNNRAGINAVEIQYKGGVPVAVMSGELDYAFITASVVVTNQARLRVLAVTTAKRALQFPDVPTIHEAALPGYEMAAWASILGPAGMPRDIVASLNTAISRALAMPDVRDRFLKAGLEPLPGSPEEVRKKYSDWIVIFGKIAKDNGLKPQ